MLSSLNQEHFFKLHVSYNKVSCKDMFNRRDDTGKLAWLFFLVLTTDGGLKFITRSHAHPILLFKERIIMSLPSEHKVSVWNENDDLKDFIGCGKEGNLDGKALHCELYQPYGICVEFDNVVYLADYKSSCIKITSTMMHTAKFLSAIRKLMRAFSIHEKRGKIWFQQFSSWLVFTGIALLKWCLKFL